MTISPKPPSASPAEIDAALALRLRDADLIPQDGIDRALARAQAQGTTLDRALLEQGQLEEDVLLTHLCDLTGLAFCADPFAEGLVADPAAVAHLSPGYLSAKAAVPVLGEDGAPRRVLLAAPRDMDLREELSFHLGGPIHVIGATARSVRLMLSQVDAAEPARTDRVPDAATATAPEIDGPVIRFVASKLADAVALGASDLHFEVTARDLVVRLRVNGILTPQPVDRALSPEAVLARLKVMANANVTERRMPQDARLTATIAGRRIDFRFSSIPTQTGESVVLRVLDPRALRLGWDRLGFDADMVARIIRIIEQPSGLFLVTGPTGSGKSTTLYTALSHLNRPGVKIVTVEDPVEYNLSGVQQVQVQEAVGLTFARVLRAILRHDPNVILVGEIRDQETAEIACRAAQVGRMVLSTLHANTPAGAATRLTDLGVPAFIVRDVLRGVLGQELVIHGCPSCGGTGCQTCGFTGTAPRTLAADLLDLT
ncbi:general secretion pathway protein E [Loktanella atrilutea]|uniref:General secretion pathway protein E n=1 Tax=Loktanella atrilutea TaxID=366533 RepID=A0A1M4UBL1_LOKAT|nr:GspE/PulE family protein [Loktanella atrilutea]SHE54129.1 general secretion pathway protein E [Loktanella atrilutea]